jgi:hypothetical protein
VTAQAGAVASQQARISDDWFLGKLPAFVREPRRAWLVIPLAWLLSFGGSVALAALVQQIAPNAQSIEIPKGIPPWLLIFGFAIFSPVVESILMGLGLKVLMRWLSPGQAIFVSAIVWGILHSLQIPVWGLAIWWPFLIFSTLFVIWQQRGFWTGVAIAAATHFLQNIGPSLAIAYPNAFHGLG